MVVQAQVGDGTQVGVFVLGLIVIILLHDVVDLGLIFLAIGVNHRGLISAAGVTLTLHMPILFAVTAHNVGVAGAVVPGRGSRMSLV
jgi:hypothetical protein